MRSVGRLARTSAALAAVSVVLIGAGGLAAWADRLDADADGDALATPHPNGLTVDQNIAFFGGIYGLKGERLAARRAFILEMAGLRGREATPADPPMPAQGGRR